MTVIPVILSGGCGSRLWPISRKTRPKQFLDFGMGSTLFRQTLERCAPVESGARPGDVSEASPDVFDPRPIIVSNCDYKYLIAEELLLAGRKADVLLEPEGRNSCPAIAAACFEALDRDENAVILVAPSDQDIPDEKSFQESIIDALPAARDGHIVLFGLPPKAPHPGYGYVGFEETSKCPFPVTCFTEKPESELASRLMELGQLWNAGIFLMRSDIALNAMRKHVPKLVENVKVAYDGRQKLADMAGNDLAGANGRAPSRVDAELATCFSALETESFLVTEPISFDCAVLEHTKRVKVLPVSYEWDDLGNWESISQNFKRDASNNRIHGSVNTTNSSNNVVQSTDRLTALFGVENLIVVDTPDALLVADRKRASEVNKLVDELKHSGIKQVDDGAEQFSPWGSFMRLEAGEGYQVKRLVVLPGASLSLQAHQHRSEHWVVIDGEAEVQIDNVTSRLAANDFIHIPVGSRHRLSNPGDRQLVVIEVQTGDYFGEDDITRFEDVYNRR